MEQTSRLLELAACLDALKEPRREADLKIAARGIMIFLCAFGFKVILISLFMLRLLFWSQKRVKM